MTRVDIEMRASDYSIVLKISFALKVLKIIQYFFPFYVNTENINEILSRYIRERLRMFLSTHSVSLDTTLRSLKRAK